MPGRRRAVATGVYDMGRWTSSKWIALELGRFRFIAYSSVGLIR